MLKKTITLVAAIILASQLNFAQEGQNEIIEYQTKKFKTILQYLSVHHVDSIDIVKFSENAFKSMLQSLDKNSTYYTAEERKAYKDKNKGSTVGIGIDLLSLNDTLVISNVVKPGPADSAGLINGDKLLFINGKNAVSMLKSDAIKELKGEKGQVVTLIVKRGREKEPMKFSIARNSFPLKSIYASFIFEGTDIGYIDYDRFSKVSAEEFRSSAGKLKEQGMKKLLIDLRGNPGGSLSQVSKVAGELFENGRVVNYTKGRVKKYEKEYLSEGSNSLIDIPVIMLIDGKSASATEALAGVIQDYDRGLVVGSQSYGKGSGQNIWDLKDGSAFRFTTIRYYTPSGRCLQKPKVISKAVIDPAVKLSGNKGLEKNLQKIIDKTGGRTHLPVFYSEKGRPLIGGGGIFPDYQVKKDTTTLLTKMLNSKNIISAFIFMYLDVKREEILEKYGNNYNLFIRNYVVSEKMLEVFIKVSKRNKTWNEEMFQIDKNKITHIIKAGIARAVWGNNAFKAVLAQIDTPLQRAIELFPEAERMTEKH